MMLDRLIAEIEMAGAPQTPAELGRRLGVAPERIAGLLAALRAGGRLAPGVDAVPTEACGGAERCAGACSGPADCALFIGSRLASLRIVAQQEARNGTDS